MTSVAPSSSANYTQPQLPPSPTCTVNGNQTVTQVAQQYGVTPEELARTNSISIDSALSPGQVLTLPPHAAATTTAQDAPATPTPAQQTDAAIAAYQAAVKEHDDSLRNAPRNGALRQDLDRSEQDKVDAAKKVMDQAVEQEINGYVAAYNQTVPGQFRSPTDQLIATAGKAILDRHQGDAAIPAIQSSLAKAKADSLISASSGNSASDKLKNIHLQGQPQDVVDATLADPRVQQWIAAAANEATSQSPPAACAKYLADLAQQSPDLGRAVAQQWWGASDLPSQLSRNGVEINAITDPQVYRDMSTVLRNLQQSGGGAAIQNDFASNVASYMEKNPMVANSQPASQLISSGNDPALALAIASNLQADGKNDMAQQMVGDVKGGLHLLQTVTLKQDMQDYAEQTAELNKLIKDLGPGLGDQQKQQAIQKYIDGKGQDWQDQLAAKKDKLIADARAITQDVDTLANQMPDNLKSYGLSKDGPAKLLSDDTTKQAIQFAATQDPAMFEGKEGDSIFRLLLETNHQDKEYIAALGKSYVVSNLMPAVGELNLSDDASVAKVKDALEKLRGDGAQMFGIPQDQVDKGVKELDELVDEMRSAASPDDQDGAKLLQKAQGKLAEIKELPFTDAGAGTLFRTMALGITGAAFISQTGKAIDDPSAQNVLGSVALGLDLAPAKTAMNSTFEALAKNDTLSKWGFGTPALTEKFIGVLNIGYFAAGTVQGIANQDYPTAIFSSVGAGGMGLATFGGDELLGGFAGPAGIAIAALATVALSFVEKHQEAKDYQEAQNKFLENAGIDDPNERAAMIEAGPDQLQAMRDSGMSTDTIQQHMKFPSTPKGPL